MKKESRVYLSVVVPLYNEEGSIRPLHREISAMIETLTAGTDLTGEIIFVNDGSTDRTDEICRSLRPLRYIRFSKNRGQTAAMDRGFHAAAGRYIASCDGDAQNDPADIPAMLKYLEDNDLDAVCGWRYARRDRPGKRLMSFGARLLRQAVLGDRIRDSGCSLKVFKRECFEGWHLKRSQHRFIPALLTAKGFRVGEMKVAHRPRTSGKSKYGFFRIISGLSELFAIKREMNSF